MIYKSEAMLRISKFDTTDYTNLLDGKERLSLFITEKV